MSKIVITDAEARDALRASGKRRFTGRKFHQVVAQLKTLKEQKMSSQAIT